MSLLPSPSRSSARRRTCVFIHALLAAGGALAAPAASAPPSATISLTGAPEVSPTGARAAASAAPSAGEAALLGAWTEGLTPAVRAQLAVLPADQAAALRAGLGDTLAFTADHTLRIYPRCAQAAQFGRAAVEGLPARWEISDARTLRVTSEIGGQPRERSTGFQIQGDELRFFERMASKPQVMGRYEGPLPPRCE